MYGNLFCLLRGEEDDLFGKSDLRWYEKSDIGLHISFVAQILTNFTTIDLSKSKARDIEAVYRFLATKNVKRYNHLISGAPTSQILSYLANHKMFDEMQTLALGLGARITGKH